MDQIVTITLNPAIDRIVEVRGFQVGGHLKGRTLSRIPAGKGVNVSRTLHLLGAASIALGFVGRDQLEEYEQSLSGTLVQPQFLAVKGTTRENITIIDPDSDVETHVRDRGVTPTATDLDRLRAKLELLARPNRIVILSGSLPPGISVGYALELIDLASSRGAKVVVDGPGALLQNLSDRKLELIKPNVAELSEMSGQTTLADSDLVRLGRNLARKINVVIITCGAAGGYLFTAESAFIGQVAVAPGRIKSTVGCGDCMLGAFVAAQQHGADVIGSYRQALAAATAAAVDPLPGRFDPAAADRLLAQTAVEPISK